MEPTYHEQKETEDEQQGLSTGASFWLLVAFLALVSFGTPAESTLGSLAMLILVGLILVGWFLLVYELTGRGLDRVGGRGTKGSGD